jgi:hypothetical protein
MTFWLIAVPSVVALCALVWWSSGRAKPGIGRRNIGQEIGRRVDSVDETGRYWGRK